MLAGSTRPAPTTFKSAASVNREPQTLEEYESAKAGGSKTAATVATAWATPKAVPKNSNPDVALQSSQVSHLQLRQCTTSHPTRLRALCFIMITQVLCDSGNVRTSAGNDAVYARGTSIKVTEPSNLP